MALSKSLQDSKTHEVELLRELSQNKTELAQERENWVRLVVVTVLVVLLLSTDFSFSCAPRTLLYPLFV